MCLDAVDRPRYPEFLKVVPRETRQSCHSDRRVLPRALGGRAARLAAARPKPVSAAAVIRGARHEVAAQHHCKCGTRCHGESCCCGSHQSPGPATGSPSRPEGSRPMPSPCQMTSAPCGDSGLPTAPSGRPVNKIAALAMFRASAARHGRLPAPVPHFAASSPVSASLPPRSTPGTPHPRLIPGYRRSTHLDPRPAPVAWFAGQSTSVA